MDTIEMDMDVFLDILDVVRKDREDRFPIPDEVYDYLRDTIEDCGITNANPMAIIDNVSVNGDYCTLDEYRQDHPQYTGMSDDEMKEAIMDAGDVMACTDNYVIISL